MKLGMGVGYCRRTTLGKDLFEREGGREERERKRETEERERDRVKERQADRKKQATKTFFGRDSGTSHCTRHVK